MSEVEDRSLRGRTIAFLETRRASELTRMIERARGIPFVVPIIREVPVEDAAGIREWLERLLAREFDVVIFLTGSGCQMLLDRADSLGMRASAIEALKNVRVVARGPKPARVLRQNAIPIAYQPPEPNTSDQLLVELARWGLSGRSIGLQLYGGLTPLLDRLRSELRSLGALVWEVAPYRWEGPSDAQPVLDLIDRCLAGQIDALAVLSSSQIDGLFAIAEDRGVANELLDALRDPRVLIAAIGPVTARAIAARGLTVDLEPEHPKMGHLLAALGTALALR